MMNRFDIITGSLLLIVLYFCIKPSYSFSETAKLQHFFRENENGDSSNNNCISAVSEILHVAHALHSAGQILVSHEWFLLVSELQLKKFSGESRVPWLVYGNSQHVTENTTAFPTSIGIAANKYTSFRFAHLHHSFFSSSSSRSREVHHAQRQQTWRKLLYLTFRQGMRIQYAELDGGSSSSTSSSKKAGLAAAWITLIQKDLFIVTFNLVQLLDSVTSKQNIIDNSNNNNNNLISSRNNKGVHSTISKHTIWIGCSNNPSHKNYYNIHQASFSVLSANYSNKQLCIYSSRKGFTTLLGHISHCKDDALTMHIDRFYQLLGDYHHHGVNDSKNHATPTKRLVDDDKQFIASAGLEDQQEELISSEGTTRRKIDPLSRKSFLYSSLVFITKKMPDSSSGNSTSSVWGPFAIASWLGILAAYTVTAIVFAVIKIVTMNNLENSWYDCIFSHVLRFMSEENKVTNMRSSRRNTVVASVCSSSIGIDLVDKNDDNHVLNSHSPKHFLSVANHGSAVPNVLETRRISVKSLTAHVEQDNSREEQHQHHAYRRFSVVSKEGNRDTFVNVQKCDQSRGKMSRTILYCTIRVVSFVLLAMYEGKLYNTITFPKSKLVATFDELISSDKYFVKVSSEAAKFENLTGQIKGNVTFRETPSGLVTTVKADGGGGNKSGASSSGVGGDGRFVESVNILDCVNWVESGPDPNHACVGYEFELRNLHKAQKSDKILVRSKQRLLRFGSAGGGAPSLIMTGTGGSGSRTTVSTRFMSRRRGFTLFPGGFQISKWILESGILQLWSIVENTFMESVINPNWSDPFKVFTIRDYLGLFVVYSMLLILASIMFLLEHIVTVLKKIAKSKRVRRFVKSAWKKCKKCKRGTKNTAFSCCTKNWYDQSCGGCCCYDNSWVYSCRKIKWKMREKPKQDRWRGTKYFRSWSAINNRSIV